MLDAIQVRAHHMNQMTTYIIIPMDNGASFNISVAGANGARQTMLGFASEAEAEAWISQDKRLNGIPETYASRTPAEAAGSAATAG